MFGVFPIMNNKLGVCGGLEEGLSSHKNEMAKFFDMDYVDKVLGFSDTLKKLAPTLEELSIIRAIIITFTGNYSWVRIITIFWHKIANIFLYIDSNIC